MTLDLAQNTHKNSGTVLLYSARKKMNNLFVCLWIVLILSFFGHMTGYLICLGFDIVYSIFFLSKSIIYANSWMFLMTSLNHLPVASQTHFKDIKYANHKFDQNFWFICELMTTSTYS